MIHSLYSNREIFLRELISNASDACDKLRFEALHNGALFEDDPDLQIHVDYDAAARTVTVTDNGVGMNRDEVIANLGTIAKSGTREFFSQLTGDQQKDTHLIGQFGVGFYSSFIVADKVTVLTRRAGERRGRACAGSPTAAASSSSRWPTKASRGTQITLHVREGQDDLLSGSRLRAILRKYSDYIVQPILMPEETWEDGKQVKGTEFETVNQASACGRGQGRDHRRAVQGVLQARRPRLRGSARVDARAHRGPAGVHAAPLHPGARAVRPVGPPVTARRQAVRAPRVHHGRRGAAAAVVPALRARRGRLERSAAQRVARDLQESKDIEAIRGGATKRILGLLEELAKDKPDTYATFWREFGRALKEGIGEDFANRERIAALLRFASTHADNADETVALSDYVARMKEGQKAIYYVTADSFNAARNSPHLEIFRKKGIEVLLLADRVDEWVVGHLTEFDGKPLQSVAKGGLDLGDLEDEDGAQGARGGVAEHADLVTRIKTSLGDRVKDVRITHRLVDSPACLVADEHDMSGNLARLLKAAGQKAPDAAPILEINPAHPLVLHLKDADAKFDDWASVLLDQALLAEGGQLDDPATFVKRINQLMLDLRPA